MVRTFDDELEYRQVLRKNISKTRNIADGQTSYLEVLMAANI